MKPRLVILLAALLLPGLLPADEPPATSPDQGVAIGPSDADPARPAGDDRLAGDALDLADCFALARARNEEVARAQAAIDRAKAERRAVRSAFRPELSLRDDFLQQERVNLGSTGGSSGVSFADRRNQAYLSLAQPLLTRWTDAPRLDGADHAIVAAERDRAEAERRLLSEVSLAYHAVLRHEREVETLESATRAGRDRLSEIGARQDVGLARRMEVLFVKSQLSGHESRLLRATNDALAARAALASLTGDAPGVSLGSAEGLPGDAAVDDAALAAALDRRPDLAAARERVLASRTAVTFARRGRAPSLDLGADVYLDREGYSDFQQATDWAATLEFSVPILDGGRVASDVAVARARAEESELARAQLERDIRLEIRQAALALESDRGELRTLEDAVAAAREAHELSAEEYRSGLATNLEVLTAQQQLLDQALELERQRIQVRLAWIALQLALGAQPEEILTEMTR